MTDERLRATYFDERAAGVIYGRRSQCERRHRSVDGVHVGMFEVIALEWLGLPEHSRTAGSLIVHIRADVGNGDAFRLEWSNLVRWKLDRTDGRPLLEALSTAIGSQVVTVEKHQEPFRIAFLDELPGESSLPFPSSRLDAVKQWLVASATALPLGSFSPGPEQEGEFRDAAVAFSSDWSAMVLRDGAAFVGHPDTNREFVTGFAPVYVRTIYTDALLIAVVQQLTLADLSDRLARLEDPARHPRGVERLDAEFSRFRNRLWWQHLTQHGPGNELMLAYQRQHRVVALMEQTKSELADYSRQASLRASRVLNVVVAVFALIGSVGVAIDLYQLFTPGAATPGQAATGSSIAIFGVVLVLVIAYPLGVISRWRPRRRRPYTPRTRRAGRTAQRRARTSTTTGDRK